ncbi:MAG: PTS fructose transporter subunit IIA [Deltaproteobacteria bacterium]|nr:PTS fructose transporter subunit IIA [Deltaproteobacteria bacterium]
MIATIVVTHHTLAESLIATAEFIVGPNPNLVGVGISQNEDVEAIRKRLLEMIKKFHKEGRNVLILTDMFGGTPSNIGFALYEPGKVEIVSGVNLPILLKLAGGCRESDKGLKEIAAEITEYGRKNIFTAAEFLDL